LSPALKSPRADLILEAVRSFLELTKKGSMRNREFSRAKITEDCGRNTRRDQRLVRVPGCSHLRTDVSISPFCAKAASPNDVLGCDSLYSVTRSARTIPSSLAAFMLMATAQRKASFHEDPARSARSALRRYWGGSRDTRR